MALEGGRRRSDASSSSTPIPCFGAGSQPSSNEPDLAVCAEAATAREALDAIAAAGPALVIADFSFEDGLGLDLVREIRARHDGLPVLMMSTDGSPFYAERALQAGASGCISKQDLDGTALAAIRAVLDGGAYFGTKLGRDRPRSS